MSARPHRPSPDPTPGPVPERVGVGAPGPPSHPTRAESGTEAALGASEAGSRPRAERAGCSAGPSVDLVAGSPLAHESPRRPSHACFRPRPVAGLDAPARLVAAGGAFEGDLAFWGVARIDGCLAGDVFARGTLLIGTEGATRGRIEVDELVVAGRVEGEVLAHRRVELRPGARLRGEVRTPRLVLADGCSVEGRCHTIPSD